MRQSLLPFVGLLMLSSPAAAISAGKIKICKVGTPEDAEEQKFFEKEVVVPGGVAFGDYGLIDDEAPGTNLIKLRVVTTQTATIKGKARCAVVSAIIPDGTKFGNAFKGPIRTTISKAENRLLLVENFGPGDTPPGKLAPWDDVPEVSATIEEDFN